MFLKTPCLIPLKHGFTLSTVKGLSKQNKKDYIERNDFKDAYIRIFQAILTF